MEMATRIRDFVVQRFLDGEYPSDFSDGTALISTGVIDSIGVLHLIDFLEKTFGVAFEPKDIDFAQLDTVDGIVTAVEAKRRGP